MGHFVQHIGHILTLILFAAKPMLHAAERPNIILMMGDDHGWEETSYNGHPYVRTPVLDEMAKTGLRFDRFYSASPVCSPTRGSVMTGRHPNRYGTFAPNWSIRPEEITIAHLLSDAGYRCAHFGKWHLGPVKTSSPTSPGAMGFDEWLSHDNFFEVDPTMSRNGAEPERLEGESSQIVVDEAVRFIHEGQSTERPFFIVIWFGSPHEPYVGLPDDLSLYADLRSQFTDRKVRLTSVKTGSPVQRPLGEVLQERFAEITAMDRAIGTLRQALADGGLRENTLLWYCGDNGVPSSGRLPTARLRGQKAQLFEGGIRVPAVIEWPRRIKEGRMTDVISVTSDMLPTLCELAGVSKPKRPVDGLSLVRAMDNGMDKRPAPIFFWNYDVAHESQNHRRPYIAPDKQVGTTPLIKKLGGRYTRNFVNFHHTEVVDADYNGARAVIDNRFKLIVRPGRRGERLELFDMKSDPRERTNVADSHPDVVKRLRSRLRAWQEGVLASLTGADYSGTRANK